MGRFGRHVFYKTQTTFLKIFGVLPASNEDLYLSGNWYFIYQRIIFFGIIILVANQFLYVELGKNYVPGPGYIVLVVTASGARTFVITVYLTIFIKRKKLVDIWRETFLLSKEFPANFWDKLLCINILEILTTCSIAIALMYTADYRDYFGIPSVQNILVESFLPLLTVSANILNLLAGNILRIIEEKLKIINYDGNNINGLKFLMNLRFLCDVWNDVFGYAYLHFFAMITIGFMYNLFHMIVNPPRFYDGWWMVFYAWAVSNILYSTSAATNQIKKTASLLMIKTMDVDAHTEQRVEAYSHQQLYFSPCFHACSFFNLEWSLATAITGAASTYTIIFYQMQAN